MKTSILLIDSEVDFRKQVAEDLGNRGFDTWETTSLGDTRALIKEKQVALVALDSKLLDEDSIDFILQLKKDHPHTGIVFLANKEQRLELSNHQAYKLGANMVVRKPIPPPELAYKIDVLLKLEDKTPGSLSNQRLLFNESSATDKDQLESLRQNYMQKIPTLLKEIGETLVNVDDTDEPLDLLDEAHRLAHNLNNTAGSLGFQEIRSVATAMEEMLKEMYRVRKLTSKPPALASQYDSTSKQADEKKGTVDNLGSITNVLIVDNDPDFLKNIVAMGKENLINVHTATSSKEALALANKQHIDAAIIDVLLEKEDNAFQIARDLRSLDQLSDLPISFISADTSISTRIEAVHAGASLFLDKPLQGTDLAAAVRHLIPAETDDQPRVFVVDDDEDFLSHIKSVLTGEKLNVSTLSDPTRVLEVLPTIRPDILLLDVVMPDINGFDVCRVLRSTEQWRDLPILFLTIYASNEILVRCFEAGGDDYIEKPAIREELLARLNVRLDRLRLFKERADRDGLTGLATRRAFIEQLKIRLSEGARFKKPVSLCLLDLDFFKKVNDTYGHLAGDRVLAGFGHLLGSRFRTMDIRGRWGGEEFAVAFYGEVEETAKMIICRLRDELKHMVFHGDHEENFSISFSAGIASFPKAGDTFEDLFRAVDKKLYEAKNNGRDRIEI